MQWSTDGCNPIDYFIVLMIYLINKSLAFIIMRTDLAKETLSILLLGLTIIYYEYSDNIHLCRSFMQIHINITLYAPSWLSIATIFLDFLKKKKLPLKKQQ